MEDFFIPVLRYFENNNIYTGSSGLMRYRVAPNIVMLTPKEVNMEESSMTAEYWHGVLCYEKSEIEDSRVFPLSLEGRSDMEQWLKDHI